MQGVSKLMRNILKGDFSAKNKGCLSYIVIFCSNALPLQVIPAKVRGAAVGGNNTRFGCNLEGKGF